MADETVTISLVLEKEDANKVLRQLPRDVGKSGQKSGDNFSSGFKRGLTSLSRQVFNLKNAFLGLGAAIGGAFALREVVQAANAQEDAINRLNAALKQNGEFSQQTSADLQAYASSLQDVTRFGDEVILNQLALAQSFGANAQQSQAAVTAAADLSAALGIDLQSATRNVSKTLGGYAGELGEVIPELKNLSQEQLRAGEGIDVIAQKFQGFARRDVQTFSGSLDQAQNAFGDLQEEFGFLITRSPIVSTTLGDLTQIFKDLGAQVRTFGEGGGFQQLLIQAITFGQGLNDFVIAPIELLFNVTNTLFQGLLTGVALAVAAVGQGAGKIGDLLNTIGISPETAQSLNDFSETSLAVFNERLKETEGALNNTFSVEKSEQIGEVLEGFKQKIQEFNEVTATQGNPLQVSDANVEKNAENLEAVSSQYDGFFNGILASQSEFEKGVKKGFEGLAGASFALGQAIKKGIGQGIGSGFAAFGAALVNGENALDAFATSFLNTLGQLMIQQGTAFILQGLGFSVIPGLQASAGVLIPTGIALAAFGGAISAVAGGGTSAAGAAAGGVGGGAIGADSTVATQVDRERLEEERQTQSTVNVNVQGDILDSDETSLRIVDLINQGLERDGAIITRTV